MKINSLADFYEIKYEITFITERNPYSGNWFSLRPCKYFDKN